VADERLVRRLATAAVLLGSLQVGASILIQDETYDEPWHLGWSRRLWDEGETERSSDLLFNSKTPVSLVNVAGEKLARAAGVADERRLLVAARAPGLGYFLALVGLSFLLGRRLAGPWAGLASAAAVALDPNVVANAAVATVDVPFAVATLLVVLSALRYASSPRAGAATALGVSFGLALMAKYTALLLLPLVLGAVLVALRRLPARRVAADLLAAGLAALLVLDAAYLAKGLFEPLGELGLRSPALRGLAASLPGLRLPLPADFLTGLDTVAFQERKHPWDVNLFGPGNRGGVAYYFVACWVLKTPIALAAATLVGIASLARRRPAPQTLAVVLAFAWLLGMLSFRLQAQLGYRLALMLVPLGVVLAAAGWAQASEAVRSRGLAAVLLLAGLESLPYLGNALAFTSALVLPKRDAFRYLAGANLDWGQNDAKVHAWLQREGLPPAVLEPRQLQPGDNVFSVNSVAGLSSPRRLRWLRQSGIEPIAHFRHTYVWFRVDPLRHEEYLEQDRSLPLDVAGQCSDAPRLEIPSAAWTPLPERNVSWLLCIAGEARGDFTIEARNGGTLVGQEDLDRRDWERLRPGEPVGYRVGPGTRTLLAFTRGKVELRLGYPSDVRVTGHVRDARWKEP
jgi:hypothetical protein